MTKFLSSDFITSIQAIMGIYKRLITKTSKMALNEQMRIFFAF